MTSSSSTKLREWKLPRRTLTLGGRTLVHVYAESSPGPEFERIEPDLEDVYFSVMSGRHPATRSAACKRRRVPSRSSIIALNA